MNIDNENNKDYLSGKKGEFIVNKKIDEEVKNETNKIEEKGEYEYIIITPNK